MRGQIAHTFERALRVLRAGLRGGICAFAASSAAAASVMLSCVAAATAPLLFAPSSSERVSSPAWLFKAPAQRFGIVPPALRSRFVLRLRQRCLSGEDLLLRGDHLRTCVRIVQACQNLSARTRCPS